jgi:hypothetical protein
MKMSRSNLNISSNMATGDGGALFLAGGQGTIGANLQLISNRANNGSGGCICTSPDLSSNVEIGPAAFMADNSAASFGGCFAISRSNVTIGVYVSLSMLIENYGMANNWWDAV